MPRPYPVCAALSGHLAGSGVEGSVVGSRSSPMASEGVVCGSAGSSRGRTTQASKGLEPAGSTSHEEVSPRPRDLQLNAWKLSSELSERQVFRRVACVAAAELRRFMAALYQSKWTRFLGWCH